MTQRLAPHAEDHEALAGLLDSLVASGLLSDARYAEGRARTRSARLGDARLRNELQQRGVDGELIAATLAQLPKEIERAQAIWLRKFGVKAANRQEWAKQARFLQSRGFSVGTIRRVLDNIEALDCSPD